MTPLYIEIGLWYWCRTVDFERLDAPAAKEAIDAFVEAGLLQATAPESSRRYMATDAMGVWVDALCSVRWPVKKWAMPDGWHYLVNEAVR